MVEFRVARIENPRDDAAIAACAELMFDLMKDDLSVRTLVGDDMALVPVMITAMLRAGALEGEFYIASNDQDELVGYTMWMPPGRDLFGTEAQRNLGYLDFMNRLSDATKEYFRSTYMAQFPGFVQEHLGVTGKTDAWWLHQAMVRKDYQRRGVVRALIGVVVEKANSKNETIASTTTADFNIAIYARLGFKHLATKMMPSPLGEWPIHLLEKKPQT